LDSAAHILVVCLAESWMSFGIGRDRRVPAPAEAVTAAVDHPQAPVMYR